MTLRATKTSNLWWQPPASRRDSDVHRHARSHRRWPRLVVWIPAAHPEQGIPQDGEHTDSARNLVMARLTQIEYEKDAPWRYLVSHVDAAQPHCAEEDCAGTMGSG